MTTASFTESYRDPDPPPRGFRGRTADLGFLTADDARRPEPAPRPAARLTPKKRDALTRDAIICLAAAHGLTGRRIAAAFGLSKTHVHNICRRYGRPLSPDTPDEE